jgi:glycerophosphoryl diester phosphodiesterase
MSGALKARSVQSAQAKQPRHSGAKPSVDLQGHRGAAGLLPENTIPSFAKAYEIGVNTLELDVVMTKDDVMVISHDPDLNPDITRGPDGAFLVRRGPRIIDLTYAQLQQYQVGALRPNSRYGARFPEQLAIENLRIPRLSDLFDWVRAQGAEQLGFAIETKISPLRVSDTASPEHVVDRLLDLIRSYRLEKRVQVLSFDWRSLQRIQRLAPGMETVYLSTAYPSINNIEPSDGSDSLWTAGFQRKHFASIPHMIKAAGGSHWSCSYPHLDRSQIEIAHQLGLKVLAWTVDDSAHMEQVLDLGIDGLVSNRPDRAIKVLKTRGQYRMPGNT